jgi:hypothetical protein
MNGLRDAIDVALIIALVGVIVWTWLGISVSTIDRERAKFRREAAAVDLESARLRHKREVDSQELFEEAHDAAWAKIHGGGGW